MLETWEIRWFGEGAIPLQLQQWSAEMNLVMQPVRSDLYLVHSGGKKLGIKWREGNLQIKELISHQKEFEQYQKWSFELKEENLSSYLSKYPTWKRVNKKREVANYVFQNNSFQLVDHDQELLTICEVELSALLLKEHLWYTIALEVNGPIEILEKALNEFKPEIPKKTMCMGYAEWVDRSIRK